MKKVISLLLVVIMALSVVTVGVASVSAAENDIAFEAGSKIFFDNSNTKWDKVYMYAWSNGYLGDFVPMQVYDAEENLYSLVVPQAVQNGDSYFLFTDSTDWSGSQTDNQSATKGYNTYTPSADAKAVVKSYTEYPVVPEVAITPYSKTFTGTIDVTVYAFNLAEGQSSVYMLNGQEPVQFKEPTTLSLDATTTVTVAIIDDEEFEEVTSTSCTFTKAEDAVITVNAEDYDGDMYVYTYGGDRLGADFNKMDNLGEGKYTYTLNGSAHVIFTTTDDWATAVKFLILDKDGNLADDQEPLVNFGEKVTFTVVLP